MNYTQISEPVFRDLLSAKAKLQDIQLLLAMQPRIRRDALVDKLHKIIDSRQYGNEEG